MKAAPFAYRRPETAEGVLQELEEPDAKVIAGGQSLVPMMVMRLVRPTVLIDLNRLGELAEIRWLKGDLEIGALVRQREAESSELIARELPLVAAALPWIGHREIRNRGTVVGSITHADPAAELPCLAATLDATVVAKSREGVREIAARDFFTGAFQIELEADELVTHVRFPRAGGGEGFAFEEVARRHGDFALCGVAVHMRREGDSLRKATLGLFGVSDRPVVLDAMEALEDVRSGEWETAAHTLTRELTPGSDMHATAHYRRRLARALIRRCLERAWADAARRSR